MPNLDFYATGTDHRLVLDFIFAQPGWTLREMSSEAEKPIRVPTSTEEVLREFDLDGKSHCFVLWAPEMGGVVTIKRINFNAEAVAKWGVTHRFEAVGWGLIQLYTGARRDSGLSRSRTNHNSEKRAQAWEGTVKELGPTQPWDFKAVTSISNRLNRYIRKIAKDKLGSRPILPAAYEAQQSGVKLLPNG